MRPGQTGESDFFLEVPSAEAARAALRALAQNWPSTILTGLHYPAGHGHHLHLIGASFDAPVTPQAVTAVAGREAKLTELTLDEIFRRVSRKEFAVALFGDAGRTLALE